MASKILKGKHILAVDDELDVMDIIYDELDDHNVELDHASTYEEAMQKMASLTYDLVILDIMGVQGFDLLEYATAKKIPSVMLTAHSLSRESLEKSISLGARAYLPKYELGRLAPFLEDVLTLSHPSAWRKLFSRLGNSFGKRFGPEWTKTEQEFRAKFQQELEIKEATIIQC